MSCKCKISVSVVVYDTSVELLDKCLSSFLSSKIDYLYLISNTKFDYLKALNVKDTRLIYIKINKNLGYGAANNIALRDSIENNITYHIVANPDVYFNSNVIDELHKFMDRNKDVGLVMPKVLYPDGSLQPLCRLLPTPFDLFARRFLNVGPFRKIVMKVNELHELRFTNYDRVMDVPFLSGCFMFLRVEVLKKIGLFDERFFLYFEDADLSRRIAKVSRTVFYPYVSIYHVWDKKSYNHHSLFRIHLESAFKYFNKWGWFFDRERKEINRKTLEKLRDIYGREELNTL